MIEIFLMHKKKSQKSAYNQTHAHITNLKVQCIEFKSTTDNTL